MWESNRDFADLTKRGVWYAVLYNALAVVAVAISVSKFGLNPLPSIQGMSDLVSFSVLLAFIFTTWGELVMLFYHLFQQARRIQLEQARQEALEQGLERGLEQGLERGLEQGLEQGLERGLEQGLERGRQEVLQRFDQAFAGDKDAMEKRDQIFNGITETEK